MTHEEQQESADMITEVAGFILGRVHQESGTNDSYVYQAGRCP